MFLGVSSCALETLSTLKFAQRAKFIRNNVSIALYFSHCASLVCKSIICTLLFLIQAIVNEDASGDVISMRLQIQQLKVHVTLFTLLLMEIILLIYIFFSYEFPIAFTEILHFFSFTHFPSMLNILMLAFIYFFFYLFDVGSNIPVVHFRKNFLLCLLPF